MTVIGRATENGDFLTQDSASMDVSVGGSQCEEGQEAVLEIRSQNPSSGVGMDFAGNSTHYAGQRVETTETFRRDGAIDVRVFAAPEADNGNEFSHWDNGCDFEDGDNDRACNIEVSGGQVNTITAVYKEPVIEGCTDPNATNYDSTADVDDGSCNYPGESTLKVGSSNPSSGVSISRQSGDAQSGSTAYNTTVTGDFNGELRAEDPAPNGNGFSSCSNCDSTHNSGLDCVVSISEGNVKTVTANYAGGEPIEGCTDPNATNYDPDATKDDGSCTYDPNKAVLDVKHTGFSTSTYVGHTPKDEMGPDGWTPYFRTYTEPKPSGDKWILSSPRKRDGHTVSGWDGCNETGGDEDNSTCVITDGIALGETKNIILHYEPTSAEGCTAPDAENYDADAETDDGSCEYQAEIDNFSLDQGDPDINFNADPPELHVDDQPFTLIWSTENANSVTASGDWNGPKNHNYNEPRNEGSISGHEETFTYNLTAHGSGGNDSDTVEITLLDPPRIDISHEPDVVDIDGEPGSTASGQVTMTCHKFNGDVKLEVKDSDIPKSLKDEEGNHKVIFEFNPEIVSCSESSTQNIEVVQSINEDLSETITITGTDQFGRAEEGTIGCQFHIGCRICGIGTSEICVGDWSREIR